MRKKVNKQDSRDVWHAVSAVFAVERKGTKQVLVQETIYLARARSAAEASRRIAPLARREAKAHDDLRWGGNPATKRFCGIRKSVWCAANPEGPSRDPRVARMHQGVEATWSQYVVRSKKDLSNLLKGRPVPVVLEE